MFGKKYLVFITVLIILCDVECRRLSSSSSRRTSSSSRIQSSKIGTQRPSYAVPTHSNRNVQAVTSNPVMATPRRSAQVTTRKYAIHTQPTVRPVHNQPLNQPTYNQPTYNQPNYNQPYKPPAYNQPGYHPPNYNQPGYHPPNYNQPGYHPPNYNQPGYHPPNYNQPGYHPPNYNQPGIGYHQPSYSGNYQPGYGGFGGYNKPNHGVRNAVFAGLGGSALGLYLGYKLGSVSNGHSYNNYGNAGNDLPRYSVVHHYYHGDKPIPQNVQVESNSIAKCDNQTNFCTPNTSPLCMANGTVYCVTPITQTATCNSTNLGCVNSVITIPCENGTNCTSTNTTNLEIPCVTNIDVFGNFADNTLSVNKISKRAADDTTNPSQPVIVSDSTTPPATNPPPTNVNPQNAPGGAVLTNQGISNKFCVTVIAEPVPKPEKMTNEEYIKYVNENPEVKEEISAKNENVFKSIVKYLFY